jgi:hypothetical protein
MDINADTFIPNALGPKSLVSPAAIFIPEISESWAELRFWIK